MPPQAQTRYFNISSDTEDPDGDDLADGSSLVSHQHLAPGTRVCLKRDVEAWFNKHHSYYASESWEGSVLEASQQGWDIEELNQGVACVYVQFRCPAGQVPAVSWCETLDGQGYFQPCGVKLWVRMRDLEVLA